MPDGHVRVGLFPTLTETIVCQLGTVTELPRTATKSWKSGKKTTFRAGRRSLQGIPRSLLLQGLGQEETKCSQGSRRSLQGIPPLPPNVTCRRVTHLSADRARRCLTSERSRASQTTSLEKLAP